MPLPAGTDIKWPPEDLEAQYTKYAEWSAWYSGDTLRLRDFYATAHPHQERGFWKFWSRIGTRPSSQKAMLHVPIAGDLAAVSGALLFGEEPAIHIREAMPVDSGDAEKAAETRLQQVIVEGGAYNRFIEAGESAAAMSGVFLYPAWDRQVMPVPVVNVVQPDNAVPVFQFGVLAEVLFHRVIEEDGTTITRHVELHTPGLIEHAVYVGTSTRLGSRQPASRLAEMGLPAVIRLPFDTLDVEYIPNMRPNRLWRESDLGLSDYSGSEGMFDALDEVYASWQRDIRHAKSRIIVPRDFLDSSGNVDIDWEVYQPMDMEPKAMEQGARAMLAQQFDIRWQEHQATAVEYVERIVSNAGYSPQTFGIRIEGRAESGTALRIRESKTVLTLRRKANFWKPALQRLFTHMLLIDQWVYGGPGVAGLNVDVELNDGIPNDITEMAKAASQLAAAKAASIETRVRLVNPHRDNAWVEAEVKRIQEEEKAAQPAPVLGGPNPAGDQPGMEEPEPGAEEARTSRAVSRDDGRTADERPS